MFANLSSCDERRVSLPVRPDRNAPSRYVVGVDLGTTNSAVAFVDTSQPRWSVQTFAVPQLVAPGVVEARETLPSFHYQRAAGELAAEGLRLPWSRENPDHAVGVFARDQGANVPGRLIASAKSWLCHSGVDRLAELLPWHGAPDVDRLSPVEVSGRYLAHIRAAWNHRFPQEPLEEQEVVLTLPASFDEVARELTVKAAAGAGLPRVVLIEEPQAAIYQWINAHQQNWEQLVRPGQKILICDIGGGTSDFTLIRVDRDSQEEDAVSSRGGRRAFDSRRRQSRSGPRPSRRAKARRRRQARAAAMVGARATGAAGERGAAGRAAARAHHAEPSRLGVATDRRSNASRTDARRSSAIAGRWFFSAGQTRREAASPAVGFSGVRLALRGRCGDHAAVWRRFSHGPSLCAHPERSDHRSMHHLPTSTQLAPTSSSTTAACSMRRCCVIGLLGVIRLAWFSQRSAKTGNRRCSKTSDAIWPLPAERRTTAWFAAVWECGSPPGWRDRISSARRPPKDHRRPCAFCRLASRRGNRSS